MRVEARRRLVEEQHRRPVDERGREVEPPAHPAGVGPHRPVGGLDEVESLEQLRGPRPRSSPARQVHEPADQAQVLAAGEVAVDRRVLAGEPDRAPHRVRLVRRRRGRAPSARPPSGGSSVVEHPDRGGLAGAVRAEQAEDRAGRHLEVDAGQRDDVAEPFDQPLDSDRRLGHARYVSVSGAGSSSASSA